MAIRRKGATALGATRLIGPFAADDFVQADGSLAGRKSSIGQVWGSGPTLISSNSARMQNGDNTLDVGVADYVISMRVAALDSTHFPQFKARYLDASNYILFQQNSGTNYYFGTRVAGTFTQLALVASTPTIGDVLKVAVSGSTVTAWLNGVQAYTGTPSGVSTTTTLIGLGTTSNLNVGRFDSLLVNAS